MARCGFPCNDLHPDPAVFDRIAVQVLKEDISKRQTYTRLGPDPSLLISLGEASPYLEGHLQHRKTGQTCKVTLLKALWYNIVMCKC